MAVTAASSHDLCIRAARQVGVGVGIGVGMGKEWVLGGLGIMHAPEIAREKPAACYYQRYPPDRVHVTGGARQQSRGEEEDEEQEEDEDEEQEEDEDEETRGSRRGRRKRTKGRSRRRRGAGGR